MLFRQKNGMLVAFGATPNHCAFYLMSASTLKSFQKELKGYDLSKGTIRFQPEKPLPVSLVRKLVKARLAENDSWAEEKDSVSRKESSSQSCPQNKVAAAGGCAFGGN